MKKLLKPSRVFFILIFFNSVHSQACDSDKRFVLNNDGTVTDTTTNLMWQSCQIGFSGEQCEIGYSKSYNWQQGTDIANDNKLAGFNDWRIPNKEELITLVDKNCGIPSINAHYFPNTSTIKFWSNDIHDTYPEYAWMVGFIVGHVTFGKRTNYGGVRLVRSL